ncbi:MAG: hypothetical protein QXS20_09910 [Candidatus Thorarchaeota archaeon]
MKSHKATLVALAAIAMIALCVPLVSAQGSQLQYRYQAGIASFETSELAVKVTAAGQVPHFHYWSPVNPTVNYHVMFVKIFEASDTDSDAVFTPGVDHIVGPVFALPSTNWEFSGFSTETSNGNVTAIHFNFTSTQNFDPRPDLPGNPYGPLPPLSPFDVQVQIRVHMSVSAPNQFKFDLIISGWQWTYDDSMLVFQFTVTESNHGENQGTRPPSGLYREQTTFRFGNGYMQYEETALAAQNMIQVRASHGEGTGQEAGTSIYLAFAYFGNSTLEYDPVLGVVSTTGLPVDPSTLLIGGIVLIVVVAVALKLRK